MRRPKTRPSMVKLKKVQNIVLSLFRANSSSAWDALIHEEAVHAESIACVFLCTPEDGLGVHEPDPLRPEILLLQNYLWGTQLQKTLVISRFFQKDSHQIKKKRPGRKLRLQTLWWFAKVPVTEEKDAAMEKARAGMGEERQDCRVGL